MKTSELTGAALDWAVGTALKLPPPLWDGLRCAAFSTNWSQGGPIIQREKIAVDYDHDVWNASIKGQRHYWSGPTPLIAAMRCYVASKLGDEVEIPEELK